VHDRETVSTLEGAAQSRDIRVPKDRVEPQRAVHLIETHAAFGVLHEPRPALDADSVGHTP
jgi:hypothetical protein